MIPCALCQGIVLIKAVSVKYTFGGAKARQPKQGIERKPSAYQPGTYHLHGQDLKTTEMMKYLGVIISQDLSWDTYITNNTKKANQTLGFLRRNLKVGSVSIKKRAYKALVRPRSPRARQPCVGSLHCQRHRSAELREYSEEPPAGW